MSSGFLLVTLTAFAVMLSPEPAEGGRPMPRQQPHGTTDRLWPRPRPGDAHSRPISLPNQCTCDEPRLVKAGQDIADLVRRMGEQETRSAENKEAIRTLEDSNRQLQSQIPRLISENQRLTRLTRSLRSISDSLSKTNRQLRTENERLRAERGQSGGDAVDQPDHPPLGLLDDDPEPSTRSSLRDLADVTGNREAELIEMGVFPPVVPDGPSRSGPAAGRTFSRPAFEVPDSEQISNSLLTLSQQNEVLTRKVEQLEGRITQQGKLGADRGIPGPQLRPATGQSPSELAEKISELERLVLVALQSPSGASASFSGPEDPTSKGHPGPTGRLLEHSGRLPSGIPGSVSAVNAMNDEDLEAMENVVARVRNSSPGKSAFSFASTGITLGAFNDPRAVEFDHEFVNKGGDFNKRRSRFVCENPGFYYITFTLRSYDDKYLGVVLMKNEELQTAVYADKSDRNVMQTQAVILQLEAGDEVWLRHAPSEHFAVHSGEHRYVTFSGYLIYRGR